MDYWQQLGLLVVGAGLTWFGSWLTGRREAKQEDRTWRRGQEAERQRKADAAQEKFESLLTKLLVVFERWKKLQEVVVEAVMHPERPIASGYDFTKHWADDKEIGKLLVELEVACRDKEMVALVREVKSARLNMGWSTADEEERVFGDLPADVAWERYASAVMALNDYNVQLRVEGS